MNRPCIRSREDYFAILDNGGGYLPLIIKGGIHECAVAPTANHAINSGAVGIECSIWAFGFISVHISPNQTSRKKINA